MTTHCWTASHIDNPDRFDTLKSTIYSITSVATIDNHWLSITGDVDVKQLVTLYEGTGTQLHLFHQPVKMKQFDHLAYIAQNFTGDLSDMVYMCDDDDVFLNGFDIPSTIQTIQGIQYIPNDDAVVRATYTANVQELEAYIETYPDRFITESDFSGYAGRASIVLNYFKRRPTRHITLASLEDIEFMNYLDKFHQSIPSEPFIFHRINPDVVGAWKRDVVDEAQAIFQQSYDRFRRA